MPKPDLDKDFEVKKWQLELERVKAKLLVEQKPFLFQHQTYM